MKTLWLSIVLLALAGCHKDDVVDPSATVAYINEVVDLMEKYSINKTRIDWQKFRDDAVAKAKSTNDINASLEYVLTVIGDNHSYVMRGSDYIFGTGRALCESTIPEFSFSEGIGYIKVPSYGESDNQLSIDLQNNIKDQDRESLVGWIVDLRGNTGGNMWPMLAGVGPILGEGIAGYFIGPDDSAGSWGYQDGKSLAGSDAQATVPNPYELIHPDPKVAVLIDGATASSGEAIAMSFKNRPNTRLIGRNTCGLSTGNSTFTLSNGDMLYLTTVRLADRNKQWSEGAIAPDINVNDPEGDVPTAIEWIKSASPD